MLHLLVIMGVGGCEEAGAIIRCLSESDDCVENEEVVSDAMIIPRMSD